jgi:hypothetical protein
MKKLVGLMAVLSMVSMTFAVTVTQNQFKTTTQRTVGGVTSQDWFTASNWGGNVNVGIPGIPQNDTETQCNGATLYGSAATSYNSAGAVDSVNISGGDAQVGQLRVGSSNTTATGNPAALTINSGSLTIGSQYSSLHNSGFMSVGSDSAAVGSTGRNGLLYVNGGSINAIYGQGNIVIGNGNTNGLANCYGKMYMTGGTVDCLNFYIARNIGVIGEVYLSGGTITANNLYMRLNGGTANVVLDITGDGKFIINGDKLSLVQTYIDNGWIKTNGEDADYSIVSYDAGTNQTILAIPEPVTIAFLALGFIGFTRRK